MHSPKFVQISKVTIIILALFLPAIASETGSKEQGISSPAKQVDIKEKWGVQILGIRLAAGGNMLDFRYRVLDTAKASSFFDRKTRPYLINQANGTTLLVPNAHKLGPLRQTPKTPLADKNYFIFFANPGVVKSGDKVTVVVGDFKAENLVVQ
ncbi:MAG: hypothetical protein HZC48_02520 [Nitrospirae bacterium]|nr:hypothetical protein [Nitrospirota bacterium]